MKSQFPLQNGKVLNLPFELTSAHLELVQQCELNLGYEFKNKQVLYHAITHASVTNHRLMSYERLEFLGDSILGFVVCEYLFQNYQNWHEGDLTKIKSNVVSRQSCADLGESLKLDHVLVVGKGVGKQGEVPRSLLANAFESVVAAIYIDGGMEMVKKFLLPLISEQVKAAIQGELDINYKSDLQQYSQKRYGVPPNYKVLSSRGPDHDKWFQVIAQVSKKSFPPAWGKNKKEAEQRAAANALAVIQGNTLPFEDEGEDLG